MRSSHVSRASRASRAVNERWAYGMGAGNDIVHSDTNELEKAVDHKGEGYDSEQMPLSSVVNFADADYDTSDTLTFDHNHGRMPAHEASAVLGHPNMPVACEQLANSHDADMFDERAADFVNNLHMLVEEQAIPPLSLGEMWTDSYSDSNRDEEQSNIHLGQAQPGPAPAQSESAPRQTWTCVDLDGTLLEGEPGEMTPSGQLPLGAAKPGAAEAMRELAKLGWRISIYTARFGDEALNAETIRTWAAEIGAHLTTLGIPFTDVWVGRKPRCHYFVDDRAIRFDGDWPDVLRQLTVVDSQRKGGRRIAALAPWQMTSDEWIRSRGGNNYIPPYTRPPAVEPDLGEESWTVLERHELPDGRTLEIRRSESGQRAIAAFVDGVQVGYAGDSFGATELFVRPEWQKLGLGRRLLKFWQREWPDAPSGGMTPAGRQTNKRLHKEYVEDALVAGEAVPANVLAEYPELAEEAKSRALPPRPESAQDTAPLNKFEHHRVWIRGPENAWETWPDQREVSDESWRYVFQAMGKPVIIHRKDKYDRVESWSWPNGEPTREETAAYFTSMGGSPQLLAFAVTPEGLKATEYEDAPKAPTDWRMALRLGDIDLTGDEGLSTGGPAGPLGYVRDENEDPLGDQAGRGISRPPALEGIKAGRRPGAGVSHG